MKMCTMGIGGDKRLFEQYWRYIMVFINIILIGILLEVSVLTSAALTDSVSKGKDFPSDGLLIKLKSDKANIFLKIQDQFGIKIERRLNALDKNIYLAKVLDSTGEKNAMQQLRMQQLRQSPMVEIAEPNYIVHVLTAENTDSVIPNDPMFSKLWGLKNTGNNLPNFVENKGVAGADIDALRAWEISTGSRSIKIAIIDTGIDYGHPDIKDNMWVNRAEAQGQAGVDDDGNGFVDDIYGYDFANKDADPRDDNKHGTHVAGTIGAVHNNGLGITGVMGEVTLMPVKFLAGNGSGSLDAAIEAIDYATKMNVDIMSNSWGGGGYSQLLEQAISRARDRGIVFVAAAGNNGTDNDSSPQYPANYQVENVISVAAHNINDALSNFSCYGKNTVHVAAPGENILSTVLNGAYATLSGTSMATPHISGAIGLLLSKEGRIPFAALKNRLLNTATPAVAYKGKVLARGRLNLYNLLTDTRPPKFEPNPEEWVRYRLPEVIESSHPYKENENFYKTVTFPGAKFMRVVLNKYDMESGYDFIRIVDKTGNEVDKVSAAGENYLSEYVEGDSVTIKMTSDYSISKWGFLIDSVDYIL
ncbi:MAG: S8 family serine peptidase [Oligoflexia bacterium]|nr:S8 family serine peptidase [Oligoflexia bacterium]